MKQNYIFFYKLFFLFILFSNFSTQAQVGIGNTSPSTSALLDIHNDTGDKGVLLPRVDIADLNTQAPVTGTMTDGILVYNTNTTTGTGFYFWKISSNQWVKLSTSVSDNIYTANGSLTSDRTISTSGKFLQIESNLGKNAFNLKRLNNNNNLGLSYRNEDDTYGASIFMGSGTRSELVFATGTADADVNNLTPTLTLNDNNTLVFNDYGANRHAANPTYILGVDSNGNVVELAANDAYTNANKDWFEENTTRAPDNITDNIYTNGKVGINKNVPEGTLHIYEAIGTQASPNNGTIVLEHGNAGGESSIVFRSNQNGGSDYGYIKYLDNGSGNGSTTENSLLEIGVQNNQAGSTFQDDVNINASGSLGINNISPHPSASIDMGRTNQGLLINRVSLNSITDATTVIGAEPDGLLVYNTGNRGTYPNNVYEGFYYWDNNRWNPLQDNTPNYGVQYFSYKLASNQTSPDLRTLRDLTVPNKTGYYIDELYGADNSAFMTTLYPTQTGKDGFVVKLVGTYEVKTAGNFIFRIGSDDGARMYIDGSLVFNDWVDSGYAAINSNNINLAKGKHKFEFWFYDNAGSEQFTIEWGTNPDGKTGRMKGTDLTIE